MRWISFGDDIGSVSSIPARFRSGKPQQYKFELPNVNHVFQPGHRIMVRIQSTLFPLYDRNPQTLYRTSLTPKLQIIRRQEVTVLRSRQQPSGSASARREIEKAGLF